MLREPLQVISVGECTIDQYLDLQRDFVGGISLNFAVNCKRSGAEKVSLLSCMGNDHGSRILNLLARENVDTSHVKVATGSTACQKIVIDASGERIFPRGGYDPGVLESFQIQTADLEFIQQHNLLASALFTQVESLFFQVMEAPFHGWRVADFLDLSDYNKDIGAIEQICDRLNIAFISGNHDLIEQLRPLSRLSNCLLVVTLGADGSAALEKGEPLFQPALEPDRVLDSTGCGDAFQAAFTVSYWNDGDVRMALHAGAQNAARVIQHYGAIE